MVLICNNVYKYLVQSLCLKRIESERMAFVGEDGELPVQASVAIFMSGNGGPERASN